LIPLLVEHSWEVKRFGCGRTGVRGRFNTKSPEEEHGVHREKKIRKKKEKAPASESGRYKG
jgi:hypothetical protein